MSINDQISVIWKPVLENSINIHRWWGGEVKRYDSQQDAGYHFLTTFIFLLSRISYCVDVVLCSLEFSNFDNDVHLWWKYSPKLMKSNEDEGKGASPNVVYINVNRCQNCRTPAVLSQSQSAASSRLPDTGLRVHGSCRKSFQFSSFSSQHSSSRLLNQLFSWPALRDD